MSVGAPGDLVNEEIRADVAQIARLVTPEELLRMIDAIFTAREQMLEFNAAAAGTGVDDGGAQAADGAGR